MTRPSMHPFVRFAFWTCPSSFRDSYGAAIVRDAYERNVSPVALSLDLLYQGIAIRFESLVRDVTFGIRTLSRSPLYALVTSLTIAIAIAANVAVASVLINVLLRPLPYANSDRLVFISSGAPNVSNAPFSYLDARDVAAQTGSRLQTFGISSPDATATITGISRPVIVEGNDVDAGYFEVLGARPEVGRPFAASDLGTRNVIISDRIWRTYFDGNPAALGRTLQLDGSDHTIVGVMGPRFRDVMPSGLVQRDYWTPIDPRAQVNQFRGTITYNGWGLVRPGVSFAAAQADIDRTMSTLVQRYAAEHLGGWGPPQLRSALDLIVAPVRTLFWILYSVVVLLLIIACANVTSLTLARATARTGEFTIREALGASRKRIAAQLYSEMGLVSVFGGIVGIVLGWGSLEIFGGVASRLIPRWEGVGIDAAVVAYAFGMLVFTTVVTGVVPAFSPRRDLVSNLKATGRSGGTATSKLLRSGFVIAEIALALAVVLSAGLVVRSFLTLTHVSVGFKGSNLYVADAPGLPKARYRDLPTALQAMNQISARLQSIPGVSSVGITSSPPFEVQETTFTNFNNRPLGEPVDLNVVSPGYFTTMGIPLLHGRNFNDSDRFTSRQVAIVSAAFARRYLGTLDVLGRSYHPHIGWKNREIRTIVGVAADTRLRFHAAYAPIQYLVTHQVPGIFGFFVVRTNGQGGGLAQNIARVYSSVDPRFPEPRVRSYRQIFADDAGTAQIAAMLFGIFALIALLLALAGVYAVAAYGVEQRTREFGIRRTIGASDGQVFANVLVGALRVSVVGIAIGLVLAALGARLLAAILFQTSPFDLMTFTTAILLVAGSSLIAAFVPALRATRIQPAEALRCE
jgi:putative ABC transport system permease protein